MKKLVIATATLLLFGIIAWFWSHKKAPEPKQETPPAPITDVAPAPPKVKGIRRPPEEELTAPEAIVWDGEKVPYVLPPEEIMDVNAPPQWTEIIAEPDLNPTPPDHRVPPPIHVDPKRNPE